MAGHQIVFKKRPLNFFLRRLLIPPSLNLYRLHFQEGETTVAEVQRSLTELTEDPRPYFLFANFMEPHDPYFAPPGFAGTIALDEDRPSPFGGGHYGEFKMREQLHVGALKKDERITPEIYLPTGRHLHNRYREEIAYFDTLLGQTISAIRATGRPTVILFVSDHGEGFGEHGEPAHGHSLFESEIRVPFILNGFGVEEGVELPFAPELVDGSRTLLEIAGVSTEFANGRNVLASTFEQRETLSFRNGQVSTFDGRWKLVANLEYDHDTLEARVEGQTGEVGAYQLEPVLLFDLRADPAETTNQLQGNGQEVARLVAAIHLRLKGDLYPLLADREFTAQEQADLDALGYGENGTSPMSH
jgi:arylsulfatase A-like enzyme